MGLGVGYGATAATAGDALRRDGCGAPHHESPAWLSSMARFASDFASDAPCSGVSEPASQSEP